MASTPQPSGVTMPMPVTTTRLMTASSNPDRARLISATPKSAGQAAFFSRKADGVADGQDRLGRIVRDLDTELFFEGHDEFDRVETVGTEIVDEAGFLGHLLGVDAEMLDHDLLNPFSDIAHLFRTPIAST